jgi:transcription elongation GreA/GreB family factor
MTYRFLRKDYDALLAKMEELAQGMWKAGEEEGLWAEQSAETWHDNFGYEQEERQQWTLSQRLDDFVDMKDNAKIVDQRTPEEVDRGCTVTIEDAESGERRTLLIGSYQVLDKQQENEISYAAPLARPLLGAEVGEEREVTVGDRKLNYRVVAID